MTTVVRITSIKLPNSLIARAANKSAAHRALVMHALYHRLEPILPTAEEAESFPINLVGDLKARLHELSEQRGIALPVLFGALAKAGLRDTQKSQKKETRARNEISDELAGALLLGEGAEDRAPQKQFWLHIAGGLTNDKIVLGEASTGVGKGRVIISAAMLCLAQGKGPVIIAAPTLKILSQLWGEFESDPVQKAASGVKAVIITGQQEFVDDVALRDHLMQHPDPIVQEWVDGGGKSNIGGALSRSGLRGGKPLCWLMEDLRAIATNFRAEDFALSENPSKTGKEDAPTAAALQQLKEHRGNSADAQIVFCTHTMLAIGAINAWRSIPALRQEQEGESTTTDERPVFLIDEAHLLEAAIANVKSATLSLYGLRCRLRSYQRERNLRASSPIGQAASLARQIADACIELHDEDRVCLNDGIASGSAADVVRQKILPLLASLMKTLGANKGLKQVAFVEQALLAITTLFNSLSGKSKDRTYLVFSPDRRFPSLSSGAASVSPELARIWGKAKGGAALVSASFYVPDNTGKLNCDHIRSTLNLPLLRMHTPLPVVWEEVYQAPTLHLPQSDTALALVPPSSAEDQAAWCDAQACWINKIAETAFGGTLVLCTAYSQIALVSEALLKSGLAPDRLVLHSGHMDSAQQSFIDKHKHNLRPVWLSLGAAWTGLDIKEPKNVPASDDFLLTDLVITRIPIGLNRSNTMLSRMDRIGFRPVAQEALLTLKQGIGRIIRREGLSHRNIWILDGRMQHSQSRFMAELVSGAFSMLTKYRKRRFF